MAAFRVPGCLMGSRFEVVDLGCGYHALTEIGSATVEEHEPGRYSVSAHVLESDGILRPHTMPDSYKEQWEAQRLADSLNQANESQTL